MCEVVHVLYDYLPSDQPHALKLAAGEIVRVAERSDDGWCLGTVGNHQLERTGWFPASYAAVIQGVQLQAGEYVDQAVRAVLSSGHGDQKLYYTNVNTNETSWQLPIMKSEAQQTPRARNDIQEHIAKAKGEVASTSSTDKISEQVVLRKKSVTSESQKQETIVYTHHSVTFNAGHSSQSQTLLSPDRMSYVDYFWSDKGDETGIDILVGRHIKGKLAVKDMASFMRERAALEEAYARSLSKLANTVFLAADHSDGTVEKAWSSMKKSLQEESSYRSAFAEKLLHEVEQPMLKFKDGQKKERKSFAALLAEGRKQLTSKYATAQRARAGVAAKQRELESRSAIMGDLEDDKRQSEIRKAKRKSVSAGNFTLFNYFLVTKENTTIV
ncbi:growth arrest-specific protein 7-like isoform X2 [Corticium candelabrum]|uniref:growth arrest-specific protein 7-like isoform X2 n=1 Tax=Corticium candelabrum TaxID=121492 RepID=UPI002E273931|nr:growth arrest-specific protein 7-like isoform X2 [Corticium candelabrum]